MDAQPRIGEITVATEVLETIARLTALAVPGVARVASPPGMRRLAHPEGAKIEVTGNTVRVSLFVMAEPHVNLLHVGRQIRAEVTRAIQDMVGMEVEAVDVYFQDVANPSERAQLSVGRQAES